MEEPTRYLRRCPRCGATVGPRAKFCSECGMPLSAMGSGREPKHDEDKTVVLDEDRHAERYVAGSDEPTRLIPRDAEPSRMVARQDDVTRVIPRDEERRVASKATEDDWVAAQVSPEATRVARGAQRPGSSSEGASSANRNVSDAGAVEAPEAWRPVPPQGSAGEAFTWKARGWLRRCMDKLVGSDIRETRANPIDATPAPGRNVAQRLRSSEWPQRLGMPKLAALVGGVLCLVLDCCPWFAATAVQGSGSLSSVATLGPWGIVRNSWELVSTAWRGVDTTSQTLTELGVSAIASNGAASLQGLASLALLVLGVMRLVALVLLILGLVSALVGESPYRFSALRNGISWTFWSAAAWLVVLPRFGWGVARSVSASSIRGFPVSSLVMSYPAGRYAWIALVVSLATVFVLRAWRRSHVVYPWG